MACLSGGVTARRSVGKTVDDEVVKSVLALQPWVRSRPEAEQFGAALRALVEAENCRRGAPEPVSGALLASGIQERTLRLDGRV